MERISLVCPNCGGIVTVSDNDQIIKCEFCGYSVLMADSDMVKTEKIRSETYKEVELKKLAFEKEVFDEKRQSERAEKFKNSKLKKCNIAFCIICVLLSLGGFENFKVGMTRYFLSSAIMMIQAVLFGLSLLFGPNIIKTKNENLYLILSVVAYLLFIPSLMFVP